MYKIQVSPSEEGRRKRLMLLHLAPPRARPHPNGRACSYTAILIDAGVSEIKVLLCRDGPDINYVDDVVSLPGTTTVFCEYKSLPKLEQLRLSCTRRIGIRVQLQTAIC